MESDNLNTDSTDTAYLKPTIMELEKLNADSVDIAVIPPKKSWRHVDVRMISSKVSYFFQNGKDSCYLPYMILFLTGIGLTPQEAGRINGLRFIGFIIGSPLWAIFADMKRIHKPVVVLLCFSAIALISSQPFISILISDNNKCDSVANETRSQSESSNTSTIIINQPNNFPNASLNSTGRAALTTSTKNELLFPIMMVMNLVASSFDGSTQGFIDSGVIQKIVETPEAEFGTQRLFGAVGYGVGAFASSLAVEYLTSPHLPCYTPVFIVYAIIVMSLGISAYLLFNSLSLYKKAKTLKERRGRSESVTSDIYRVNVNVRKLLIKTLWKFSSMFFLVSVLVVGTIHAIYIAFLFVLLRDINCPNIVMGLSIVVGAIASAIGIKFSQNLINICGDSIRVLCIGCLSWAVRFLLFYYLYNPWLVLPIQFLQSFGYGIFISVSVVHIRHISKPSIYTSMYGIFNGLFFGAGAVCGNLIGGAVLESSGTRSLFFGTSMAGFAWTFVMLFYLTVRYFRGGK